MHVFLVGFRHVGPATTPVDLTMPGAAAGHVVTRIRDWSSLTADDMSWGVFDAPETPWRSEIWSGFDVEIAGAVELLPDPEVPQPGGDWATTMSDVLPADPPPELRGLLAAGDSGFGTPYLALPPNLNACGVCGWIGAHDPSVWHPSWV